MRRRSSARSQSAKAQRRKTVARKSRIAPKAVRPRDSSAAREETKVARLTRERDEALQQQRATADLLKVISRSAFELQTVLDTLLESAARLCDADKGVILRPAGDARYYVAATFRHTPEFIESQNGQLFAPGHNSVFGRVLQEGKSVQIPDVLADPEYALRETARLGGFRTNLGVPLLRERIPIGVLLLHRAAVRPFTEKQIKLVETFADQAVIAIENTRLLDELRQRTSDLSEALDQQTATSEVLQVISGSPGDLQPVFAAMLGNAARICDASFGNIFRWDGDALWLVATHNTPPAFVEHRRRVPFRPDQGNPIGEMLKENAAIHVADLARDERYIQKRDPEVIAAVELGGIRTFVAVPMLKDDTLIGVIILYRQEVRPFTDKQIELVKSFAAQAVIAIENARLLNELRQRTTDLTERTADLTEALEQQTATSEVLRVISRSPGDLKPVFQTMLENATRICEAKFGTLFRFDGKSFYPAADVGTPPELSEYMGRPAFQPLPGGHLDRVLRTKQLFHTADDTAEAVPGPAARLAGARSTLCVPMLKDDALIGAIVIYRQEVRPFTDKQIELLTNFAAQAAIAIENTRLLNELRRSLEQQTAAAEVLRVISSSPGELEPVFQAMLENATRICEANFGTLTLFEGDAFRLGALYNAPPAFAEFMQRGPIRPGPNVPLGRVARTKQVVHVADIRTELGYIERDPLAVAGAELGGYRTILVTPMLKEDELIGAIAIFRQEVLPFTDTQIELVTNFANQAVIAIENTRLLSELRESLQQQTATADVLKVISRSTFDLQTVLETLVESAAGLCAADKGTIQLAEGDVYRVRAHYGLAQEAVEYALLQPQRPGRSSAAGRVALEGKTVQITDVLADPEYHAMDYQQVFGYRTILGVPLLRDGKTIGSFSLLRDEVSPFTDKQIELVTVFADQAVIAVENARLLTELRESLQRQTATADVLKVISRSTFDLRTVLQTLLESAARFCDADKASIIREKDGAFYAAEAYGYSDEFLDYMKSIPIKAERGSASGRALAEGRVVHITDVAADPEYKLVEGARLGDYRTVLCVPMLREDVPIGLLVLTRSEVQPFTHEQIELVTTFADQAAIAIENVRLFEAEQQRTRELGKSLEDLQAAQDRLVQTEKLASLGQLTAGIAHEIKNPLNFVNNFSAVSVELIDELRQALAGANLDNKLHAEISEVADMLQGNLDKVVQHGKRADAIVKNMLLHSRHGSGEHRPVDINALVDESLNLAYHGARAEKQGFNITLERSFDPAAGEVDLFPQEITRALLNLISNGFYAATKRRAEANGGNYEPTLAAATKNLGDSVEIRIRDNGTGIPPEVREKLFNPFFTTKPAGEGTGLGLSISHDIIVKQHGGSIEVDTQPGKFTEFKIVLPRAAVSLIKSGERM